MLVCDAAFAAFAPASMSEIVPPTDSSVTYDLRVPADLGKLVTIGHPGDPDLWFTWARPMSPIIPPLTGQPWIWVEHGPVLWLVDMRWRRDLMSPRQAARAVVRSILDRDIGQPGEEVVFYRNSGRYGRATLRN